MLPVVSKRRKGKRADEMMVDRERMSLDTSYSLDLIFQFHVHEHDSLFGVEHVLHEGTHLPSPPELLVKSACLEVSIGLHGGSPQCVLMFAHWSLGSRPEQESRHVFR